VRLEQATAAGMGQQLEGEMMELGIRANDHAPMARQLAYGIGHCRRQGPGLVSYPLFAADSLNERLQLLG
jgi:hypothetical protein